MEKLGYVLLILAATATPASPQRSAQAYIQAIRFWSFGDVTRVVIQTQGNYRLTSDQIEKPWRVYFDLSGAMPRTGGQLGVQRRIINDQRVKEMRVAQVSRGKTRIV